MSAPENMRGQEHIRRDHQMEDTLHDPYHARHKPAGNAVCPDCGVVFDHGQWGWTTAPDNAHEHVCPACHRVRDQAPAGILTLSGPYLAAHATEIMQLMRNQEVHARAEHPLDRIMDVQTVPDGMVVRTTGIRLARHLGDAVRNACQGTLDIQYARDEHLVRVSWRR